MMQRIIQEHTQDKINQRIKELEKDYRVTITHISTCEAPELYNRYDVMTTLVVRLEGK